MKGKVKIEWRDLNCDWHDYEILDAQHGWARLKGIADEDGNPFTGGIIWVPLSDICMMEEVESK